MGARAAGRFRCLRTVSRPRGWLEHALHTCPCTCRSARPCIRGRIHPYGGLIWRYVWKFEVQRMQRSPSVPEIARGEHEPRQRFTMLRGWCFTIVRHRRIVNVVQFCLAQQQHKKGRMKKGISLDVSEVVAVVFFFSIPRERKVWWDKLCN